MSDADLVRQTLQGQTAAYGELARRWSAPIMAFCHAKAGRTQAEDLAQESLLRGFRALKTLAEPEKFGSWLRGIALRVCLDWLKSKQTHQVTFGALSQEQLPEEMLAAAGNGPEQTVEMGEQVEQLLREVQALPEEYREVLLLYYYSDATYRDLAELLGVSAATVNARLTKARARLRERLSGLQK